LGKLGQTQLILLDLSPLPNYLLESAFSSPLGLWEYEFVLMLIFFMFCKWLCLFCFSTRKKKGNLCKTLLPEKKKASKGSQKILKMEVFPILIYVIITAGFFRIFSQEWARLRCISSNKPPELKLEE